MRREIDVIRNRQLCGATLFSPWHSRDIRCRAWGKKHQENQHEWWNRRGDIVKWVTDDEGRPTAWGIYRKNENEGELI